jgi:hypothetical protein
MAPALLVTPSFIVAWELSQAAMSPTVPLLTVMTLLSKPSSDPALPPFTLTWLLS